MHRFGWLFLLLVVVATTSFAVFFQSSDQLLEPTPQVILQLKALRAEPKFTDLPGAPAPQERATWEPVFNTLLDSLVEELPANPSKKWLLSRLDPVVAGFYLEDTELRERCVAYVERILKIAGVTSTDGAFYKYLIFI